MMVVAMGGAGLLGVSSERVAYRPLRNANRLAPLITAIGVSLFLESAVQAWVSPAPVLVPTNALVPQTVLHAGSVETPLTGLILFAASGALMIGLTVFFCRPAFGSGF